MTRQRKLKRNIAEKVITLHKAQDAGILNTGQIADKLGVSVQTISDWKDAKIIPYTNVSERITVYNLADVIRALLPYALMAYKPKRGTWED